MNQITDEQFKKIVLLDKLFGAVGVEQLRDFVESEQIVSRLSGTNDNPQLLLTLIHERDLLAADNAQNKQDIISLKNDVKSLVSSLAQLYVTPYSSELNDLKNKHGIY